jgi:hypothetical protein
MSLFTTIQRLRPPFHKPRSRPSRAGLTRTQRRARDVMSISSASAFFAGGWWAMLALATWQATRLPGGSNGSIMGQRMLERWHLLPSGPFDPWLLALAWLLGFVATMAPLVCLRRLGKALYVQPPLSAAVARCFLWLGHALIANIVVGFIASWIGASQIAHYRLTVSFGFWGTLTAAMLAYVVADLVREGARAIEENREFV